MAEIEGFFKKLANKTHRVSQRNNFGQKASRKEISFEKLIKTAPIAQIMKRIVDTQNAETEKVNKYNFIVERQKRRKGKR